MQLEETVEELEKMDDKFSGEIDLCVPYRTALRKALSFLKKPYTVWQKLSLAEQQKLFFFIFLAKLPYDKNTGYRTTEIPCAVKLFEEFAAPNSDDVDLRRIALRTRPCHGRVLLLYYRPYFIFKKASACRRFKIQLPLSSITKVIKLLKVRNFLHLIIYIKTPKNQNARQAGILI